MLDDAGVKAVLPVSVSVLLASLFVTHPAASVCGNGISVPCHLSVLPLPLMLMAMPRARAEGKNMAGAIAEGVKGSCS